MSKTKEEILVNKGEAWEYSNTLLVSPYQDALNAMDEYAKQQAIAFRIWMSDMVPQWLSGANDAEDYVKSPIKPLDEYYNLFLEHQKQQL